MPSFHKDRLSISEALLMVPVLVEPMLELPCLSCQKYEMQIIKMEKDYKKKKLT